jgi:CO/xanthine dehydrogenase Mo-binding subunit
MAVYTNNGPAGAFRGFGVTQSCFAFEHEPELLAEAAGTLPWEIRYITPSDRAGAAQRPDRGPDTAYAECLEAVTEAFSQAPTPGSRAR